MSRDGGIDSGDVREKEFGVQRLPGLGVRSEGSGMKIQTGDYENRNDTAGSVWHVTSLP